MSRRIVVEDDDTVITVAVKAAQSRRIVAEGLGVGVARLLEAAGDDGADLIAPLIEHLVIAEARTFFVEVVHAIDGERDRKQVRISEFEADIGPRQHSLDGLAFSQAGLAALRGSVAGN